jgi:rhodanese-related sulfurtransferase
MITTTQLQEINPFTLKQLLDKNRVLLIDVREADEFATEHIPGAKLMPLSHFEPTAIPRNSNKKIVLQCKSGNRTRQAAQKMFEAGFTEACHLQGGISAWKAAGYPVQVEKNTPISMFSQVQIVAGLLVCLGTILGALISPWFLILSGLVGAGLIFAGVISSSHNYLQLKSPHHPITPSSQG